MLDVSLCALSEALAEKTILIQGLLKDQKVHILIDTGSFYSYISSALVKQLNLKFELVEPLTAIIANGSTVINKFPSSKC